MEERISTSQLCLADCASHYSSFLRETSKIVDPHVKQEDEGKFRCKLCSKLFKATSFVEKHVANKHADELKVLDYVSELKQHANVYW